MLFLKGGDLAEEIAESNKKVELFSVSDYFKEEFFETLRYYKRQLELTGVKLELGARVSADDLHAGDFDEVILATGIVPRTPPIEGVDHPKVLCYLDVLRDKSGRPPDIEFAHDGKNFYLLQCRSQSYAEEYAPAPIPQDVPRERIVFSASRYISNGRVPDCSRPRSTTWCGAGPGRRRARGGRIVSPAL